MKANLAGNAVAALSLSPTNQIFSGDYRLHFDAWVNVNGPFPGGDGGGSTEFLTGGIGTSGARTEWNVSGSTADGTVTSSGQTTVTGGPDDGLSTILATSADSVVPVCWASGASGRSSAIRRSPIACCISVRQRSRSTRS